jgi:hypothetical protein
MQDTSRKDRLEPRERWFATLGGAGSIPR